MKILFISMPSIHVIRWIENLKDTSFELYWFDVLNRGKLETNLPIHQIVDWKIRKRKSTYGEHFLRKKTPLLHSKIESFLETSVNEKLEEIINEINPDVIHSFEMQNCSYKIVKTMNKYSSIKWLYSCWGSDLFYYKNFRGHKKKIHQVLNRLDFLHTDCERDFSLAKELGFKGYHVGLIPGGSGYDLIKYEDYKTPIISRKIILVKGYQHDFGRALNVIKALKNIKEIKENYEVVIFGTHNIVIDYIKKNNLPFKVYTRHELSQTELMKLMGKSLIYIGNSVSDGMPNTLLEAIIMNAFPIQSNPGNVTSEIIDNEINGLLINNSDDIIEIKNVLISALKNPERMMSAAIINTEIAKDRLDKIKIQKQIVSVYKQLYDKNFQL